MGGSAMRQAELWGARAQDWADGAEPKHRPLFEAVLRDLEVGPGVRYLDVGCGSGLAVAMAAERGAKVSGLDATSELLEIARRRTPSADFRQGDLEGLPFADAAFDLVTGFNAFQFAADPGRALREARRTTRPRGHVVVATWGRPEDCEAAALLGALKAFLPPQTPGAAGPFTLSDETALRSLVEQNGLTPVKLVEVDCPWEHPDQAGVLRGLLASGPGTAAMRAVGGEAPVAKAVIAALEPFRRAGGGYRLENKFRYLVTTV